MNPISVDGRTVLKILVYSSRSRSLHCQFVLHVDMVVQIEKELGQVRVKWKHSASSDEWRGANGPSTPGFVVLNRVPYKRLKKLQIKKTFPVMHIVSGQVCV